MSWNIFALDPGREKCGLAVVADSGEVLWRSIIATVTLGDAIKSAVELYAPRLILLGNGTTSQSARETLLQLFPELPLLMVDEYRTTDAARQLYWEENPPRGWRSLIPLGMQVPPEPVDDYVAVLFARRYLQEQRED